MSPVPIPDSFVLVDGGDGFSSLSADLGRMMVWLTSEDGATAFTEGMERGMLTVFLDGEPALMIGAPGARMGDAAKAALVAAQRLEAAPALFSEMAPGMRWHLVGIPGSFPCLGFSSPLCVITDPGSDPEKTFGLSVDVARAMSRVNGFGETVGRSLRRVASESPLQSV